MHPNFANRLKHQLWCNRTYCIQLALRDTLITRPRYGSQCMISGMHLDIFVQENRCLVRNEKNCINPKFIISVVWVKYNCKLKSLTALIIFIRFAIAVLLLLLLFFSRATLHNYFFSALWNTGTDWKDSCDHE